MMMDAIALPMPDAREKRGGRQAPQKPMDEARFEAFYRKTAGNLWSYLYRLTGDAMTADDLLQKAFFRLLRANPQVATDDHLRNWIFRAATNVALDHFRETKRDRARFAEAVKEAIAHEPEDLRHDMARVFEELKPRERALLWLAHVEESDHEEIGEALGVKTRSVKVLLFRARKRLGEL
ncbi:MAG TPA: RNA polymerase sigma factor, partial [Thermoanaerobaculia bacterium]|nr:RNA polymerase sigma factor [Thermoanaerobaculia bacterium]